MKDIKEIKLAFLGSGFMAQAMIRGIINAGTLPAEHVYAVNPVDPDTCVMLSEKYGIVAATPEMLADADVIFFAIKPQTFPEACEMYAEYFTSDKVYLTIMAGVSWRKRRDGDGRRARREIHAESLRSP